MSVVALRPRTTVYQLERRLCAFGAIWRPLRSTDGSIRTWNLYTPAERHAIALSIRWRGLYEYRVVEVAM